MNYRLRLEMLEDRCVPNSFGGITSYPARTISSSPIAAVERLPQVQAASPSASQTHVASPLAQAVRTQETTSVHPSFALGTRDAYDAYLYAYYAWYYSPSGTYAHTYASYAEYYAYYGYVNNNHTDEHLAYEYSLDARFWYTSTAVYNDANAAAYYSYYASLGY